MGIADHEWKIGDKVLIDSNRYGRQDPHKLATVEKVTKTQFTAGGIRFKPWGGDSGREIGGDRWYSKVCHIATPERIAENDRRIKAQKAEQVLYRLSEMFRAARGDDAIKIAEMLPEEVMAMAQGGK
jgi:hypothetical protein